MEASTHIHDVASGEHEGIDPDAMRAIPVLKPPKRSSAQNVARYPCKHHATVAKMA